MKTTPLSTLTGGHIMETLRVLQKIDMLLQPHQRADLAALRNDARNAASLLRIHSGLESLRIEVREEA